MIAATSHQTVLSAPHPTADSLSAQHGYMKVNGINMYYEIYGEGQPLVLIHGGGSTIQSNFETIIPMLAQSRKVIAVELEAHGRTEDRPKELTFEQDADDVAALLKNLKIEKADFLGFSNGGTTTMQIAIRHPEIVNKIILGSALCKRDGVPAPFWGFMEHATMDNMPQELKTAYLKVNPDPAGLKRMHDKDASRMVHFKDIPDEQIKSITAPTLIIIGDKDLITPEHAVYMQRLIKNSELAIIPCGHGEYLGIKISPTSDGKEATYVVPMMEKFLNKSN